VGESVVSEQVKVHHVLEGPFEDEEDGFWWMEVLVECQGEVFDMVLCHEEMDAMYDIVKKLKAPSLEPFVIGEVEFEDDD